MTSKAKTYVKRRAAEPSTYGGVAGIAAILLQFVPPQYQAIAGAVGALAGAVAALKGDPARPEVPGIGIPGSNDPTP